MLARVTSATSVPLGVSVGQRLAALRCCAGTVAPGAGATRTSPPDPRFEGLLSSDPEMLVASELEVLRFDVLECPPVELQGSIISKERGDVGTSSRGALGGWPDTTWSSVP